MNFEEDEAEEYSIEEKYPWLTQQTQNIINPNLRLHSEIIDFYFYIKPKENDFQKRTEAVKRISSLINEVVPTCKVMAFGSYATGLYLPNADVDLVIIDHNYENNE